jgi:alpha-glucosidase (family GH31 glycosyl hydrolase)
MPPPRWAAFWLSALAVQALAACSCGAASKGTSPSAADASVDASVDAAVDGGIGACTATGEPRVPAAERVPNGNPVLPPKWAFGILWGSYYDQTGSSYAQGGDIVAAATHLRSDFAGDLMWIDSSWLWHDYANGGPYYVCFQFDPTVFPDPAGMIQMLRDAHFHFGVWQWPWMGHGCSYFQAGVDNRYFVMSGAQPALASGGWHGDPNPAAFDFTDPAAVAWWKGLNQPLTDWGLDFLKLDTTLAQQLTPVTSGGGTLFDATASYTHERNRAAYEITKLYATVHDPAAAMNGARGFVLPKAASPGNDQLPGWWTDDTPATFAGLQTDMARASALDTTDTAAYWGGDTGGYGGVPDDELYVRWLEYSAFTPLQEFFGAKDSGPGARFPWLFGAQAAQIQKQYSDLRYRLLPFRYSNALIAYVEKPTVYPVHWIGSTQIVLGGGSSQILVQPVTTAGATTASVTLPPGTWIHYWTGQPYTGTASVGAPLDQVPMFVKVGSIIPMGPSLRWVDEVTADPLTLDVYPGGSTSYTLYEDDGVTEGYMGGAYSTTKVACDGAGGKPVVTIGAQVTAKYAYRGQLCARTYVLEIHGQASAPASVTRDGKGLARSSASGFSGETDAWYFDAAAHVVWVTFRLDSNKSATVSL